MALLSESFHHIYLKVIGSNILMSGTYWRSFIQAFDIVDDNITMFSCNEWNGVFNIKVVSGMVREKSGHIYLV
jgi:hypothetical protein